MTRESLFRSSFEGAFGPFIGISPASRETNIARLAPSDFPSWTLEFGPTNVLAADSFGRILHGRQEFTVTLRFAHAQLAVNTWLSTRSDYTEKIVDFFCGVFTPPGVSPGDTFRIEGIWLETIEPSPMRKLDKIGAITARCYYTFTQF